MKHRNLPGSGTEYVIIAYIRGHRPDYTLDGYVPGPTVTLISLMLLLLSALSLLITGWLLLQLRQQKRLIGQLSDEMAQISPSRSATAGKPQMTITLKVRDPIAVARRESRSARLLADRLPYVVERMVYQQLIQELAEELGRRDIEAELSLDYRYPS